MTYEWRSLYDGAKEHSLAECAQLRAGRRVQRLRAFVEVGDCLNREIDAASYGRFSIARQEAVLGVNFILLRTGLEASVGAQVGAVFYERTTLPMLNFCATPQRLPRRPALRFLRARSLPQESRGSRRCLSRLLV
jgi:hypothetical protein